VAYFERFAITVRRVITDNCPCFISNLFCDACREFSITPKRTRHYRPQTNGKAERFIQTAIREWAYARRYENSEQRRDELTPWDPPVQLAQTVLQHPAQTAHLKIRSRCK